MHAHASADIGDSVVTSERLGEIVRAAAELTCSATKTTTAPPGARTVKVNYHGFREGFSSIFEIFPSSQTHLASHGSSTRFVNHSGVLDAWQHISVARLVAKWSRAS